MQIGNIHSLESFGTVDGPGIRFVVFMQGCPLRCLFCHNPDTWNINQNAKYQLSPEQLFDEVIRYKSFIKRGGVTVTGGEPLVQAQFVTDFFRLCEKNNIHTALDTSGAIFNDDTCNTIRNSKLVLLDIKSLDNNMSIKLTGQSNENTLKTLEFIEAEKIPVWIRHVVVPQYTDDDILLRNLAKYLSNYKMIQRIEILPYHTLGVYKYKQLNIPYRLDGVSALSINRANEIRKMFGSYGFEVI